MHQTSGYAGEENKLQRRGWIELSAWVLGLGLCALYAAARMGFDLARTAGLDSARQASSLVRGSTVSVSARDRTQTQIDQSLWSKERIKAFAESLSTPAAPEGVLRIPSIGLEVPIYSGTGEI